MTDQTTTTTIDLDELETVVLTGHRQSTNTFDTRLVIYRETTVRCCETQGTWTTSDETLAMWDTSGCGTWELKHLGQCGGCGSIINPTATMIAHDIDWMFDYEPCGNCDIHTDPSNFVSPDEDLAAYDIPEHLHADTKDWLETYNVCTPCVENSALYG